MKGPILNGVAMGALRPGVVAVRKQRCENCAFIHKPATPNERGTCRFNPPAPILVMVGVDTKGVPVMQPAALWPIVGPADYCHRWKAQVLGIHQGADDGEQAQS